MIRAFRKTCDRSSRFLGDALVWRPPEREYTHLAWVLLAGLIWLAVGWVHSGGWQDVATSLYLFSILLAICAIDARYGIIPDSLSLALAAGGVMEGFRSGGLDMLWHHAGEAVLVSLAAVLLRAGYRQLRGYDGLGLGDVKFLAAAVLWIGLESVSVLLIVAVLSALISLMILRLEGEKLHGGLAISFGPHLAIGLWLAWIVGPFQ
jgi:leader peptidase (prepilin peptidase) / N-methyltransferase